ncbi:MAG: DUF501 domain-containing protein [Actinobacteria bacterium]|nr:DUF501 domain-containing protein [Actinomycetota bacterium]NDH80639.1 DUF501 domain-containing protein [Actinomycetota bacterium]NDH98968.1 DUF501 domain-containing protein [Actinomycetota bacterium]
MKDVQPGDLDCIEFQLGRTPRDVHAIGFRCACSKPAVVQTPPRLSDGTPFPTFYYATCPRLTGAISTLESSGLMAEMNERLTQDPVLAAAYAKAHEAYLVDRDALGLNVEEVEGISAGGMPDRVKCLHSLVAHSLSAGPGVNPLGDEALSKLPQWWKENPCNTEMNA